MAVGWARALAGPADEIMSAGIEAHGKNPRAIAVMAVFRDSRDDIRQRVAQLLERLSE